MVTLVFNRFLSNLGLGIATTVFVCSTLAEPSEIDVQKSEEQIENKKTDGTQHLNVASPEYWLEKMALAFSEETYAGTFTYIRGKEFNTMRIVHDASGDTVRESILKLNGQKIDIRR